MKRFWWLESKGMVFWDNGKEDPCCAMADERGLFDTDYLGSSPREIQSAEYNPETGRIKLVPKEPVRVKTLREAAQRWMLFCVLPPDIEKWKELDNDGSRACVELCEAIEREKQQPINPYTKAAVDEALDALKCIEPRFFQSGCDYLYPENVRTWEAVQALLRQREAAEKAAANGT